MLFSRILAALSLLAISVNAVPIATIARPDALVLRGEPSAKEALEEITSAAGNALGNGNGNAAGNGNSAGNGSGSGDGNGNKAGNGSGSGNAAGNGSGSGNKAGNGNGNGNSAGNGSANGSGNANGIFNGDKNSNNGNSVISLGNNSCTASNVTESGLVNVPPCAVVLKRFEGPRHPRMFVV